MTRKEISFTLLMRTITPSTEVFLQFHVVSYVVKMSRFLPPKAPALELKQYTSKRVSYVDYFRVLKI